MNLNIQILHTLCLLQVHLEVQNKVQSLSLILRLEASKLTTSSNAMHLTFGGPRDHVNLQCDKLDDRDCSSVV